LNFDCQLTNRLLTDIDFYVSVNATISMLILLKKYIATNPNENIQALSNVDYSNIYLLDNGTKTNLRSR